jgi:hypothetical protein
MLALPKTSSSQVPIPVVRHRSPIPVMLTSFAQEILQNVRKINSNQQEPLVGTHLLLIVKTPPAVEIQELVRQIFALHNVTLMSNVFQIHLANATQLLVKIMCVFTITSLRLNFAEPLQVNVTKKSIAQEVAMTAQGMSFCQQALCADRQLLLAILPTIALEPLPHAHQIEFMLQKPSAEQPPDYVLSLQDVMEAPRLVLQTHSRLQAQFAET